VAEHHGICNIEQNGPSRFGCRRTGIIFLRVLTASEFVARNTSVHARSEAQANFNVGNFETNVRCSLVIN
jgi:hypothetical protein